MFRKLFCKFWEIFLDLTNCYPDFSYSLLVSGSFYNFTFDNKLKYMKIK